MDENAVVLMAQTLAHGASHLCDQIPNSVCSCLILFFKDDLKIILVL